ncbi:Ribosome biogenesis protein erb1, partial [Cryomyces antarcticus]
MYSGHEGRVRSLAIDPSGKYLASGGDDGTVRVWELLTGRQLWSVKLDAQEAVDVVRWRPGLDAFILSATAGESIYLVIPLALLITPELEQSSRDVLDAGFGYAASNPSSSTSSTLTAVGTKKEPPAKWARPGARLEAQGVFLKATVRSAIKVLAWHRRGDYFTTVSPRGQSSAIAIHTLSKHLTQLPFRRLKGLPQAALFHPSKPVFFVATQRA